MLAEKLERNLKRDSVIREIGFLGTGPLREQLGVSLSYDVFSWFCSISLLCGYYNLEQEHKKRVHYNQIERQSWKYHRIQNRSVSWVGIFYSLLFSFFCSEKFKIYPFSYLHVCTFLCFTKDTRGHIV